MFESWIKKTEYDDELKSSKWIFWNTYNCPAKELLENIDNYAVCNEERDKFREQRIKDLYLKYGITALKMYIDTVTDESYWANILMNVIDDSNFSFVANYLMASCKYKILGGILDMCDENLALDYLQSEKDSRNNIIENLYSLRFLSLFSIDERRLFWKNKFMIKYSDDEYLQLLEFNPEGILTYLCMQINKGNEEIGGMVFEVFKAICDCKNEMRQKCTEDIQNIIEHMDKKYYTGEWAELCLTICEKYEISTYPECVRRYIFTYPNKIRDVIAKKEYNIFLSQYALPRIAYDNYSAFEFFFKKLIAIEKENMINYSAIGNILGKTGVANDGYFPHEFTRQLLEELDDREVDTEVAVQFDNLQEIRLVTDGRDQEKKKLEYLSKANELSVEFPHTANVLKHISWFYGNNAKNDFISSEMVN